MRVPSRTEKHHSRDPLPDLREAFECFSALFQSGAKGMAHKPGISLTYNAGQA